MGSKSAANKLCSVIDVILLTPKRRRLPLAQNDAWRHVSFN
jgi:hypothetical protein